MSFKTVKDWRIGKGKLLTHAAIAHGHILDKCQKKGAAHVTCIGLISYTKIPSHYTLNNIESTHII